MNAWTPNPALYLSPEMVNELALGIDPPLQIAQKYGLTAAEFTALQAQEWFGAEVFRRRDQLHAEGMSFQVKAKMIAEEVMQDFFQTTKTKDVRPEHILEFLKQTAEYGGLKQKVLANQGPAGPAFMIQINLPAGAQGPGSAAQLNVTPDKPAPMVLDLKAMDPLPPLPAGMKVPDFKLTKDLVGETPK